MNVCTCVLCDRDENDRLKQQLAAERAKVALAVEAATKLLDVPKGCEKCNSAKKHAYSDATTPGFFYTECEYHQKLRLMIQGVITTLQSSDALVEIRREAARECAEITEAITEAVVRTQKWISCEFEAAVMDAAKEIRAKFGVTE